MTRAAGLLVLTALIVPCLAVGVALAQRPSLPTAAAVAGPDVDVSVPVAPSAPTLVSTSVEPLPLVVDADATPRRFVDDYRRTAALDGAALVALVIDAYREFDQGSLQSADATRFLSDLVLQMDQDPAADKIDYQDVDLGTDAFRSVGDRGMAVIARAPGNAMAIDDLALALFALGVESFGGPVPPPIGDVPVASSHTLRKAAILLLERGREAFPDDHAMTVDLAYLRSLDSDAVESMGPTIDDLRSAVAADPADATAKVLLASLLVRFGGDAGLREARQVGQGLIDGGRVALGHLVRGDVALAAADLRRPDSPFVARSLVVEALADYDEAIRLSGDPAAYTGRALALDALGYRGAAADAQRVVTAAFPGSAAMWLRAAALDRCADDRSAWADDARHALAAVEGADQVLLSDSRVWLEGGIDRGYGGYSIGSERLTSGISPLGAGGGAQLITLDPFGRPTACVDGPSLERSLDAAVETAELAAIASGDPGAARAALGTWQRLSAAAASAGGDSGSASAEQEVASDLEQVARLVAGAAFDPTNDPRTSLYDLAWKLPPAVERDVCSMLADVPGTGDPADSPVFGDQMSVCGAEGLYRLGDDAAAVARIAPAIRLDDPEYSPDGATVLAAGILSERAGDLDQARLRYESAATHQDTTIAGLAHLGDLALGAGDARGALQQYDLAAAAIRTQTNGDQGFYIDAATARPMQQYLDSNRGIALLETAQTGPGSAPDCLATADTCAQAAAAFASALAADPLNPVYLTNAAWVARLSGDVGRARDLLAQAVAAGTPLAASVHNDLGVLDARQGAATEARQEFLAALSAAPDYDLPRWNLGVLASSGGDPLGGQALFADAVAIGHDLRSAPIAYRADDRVYRVDVTSPDRLVLASAPGSGAAAGAAAFGAIATVGALARLVGGLGGHLEAAADTVATETLSGRRRPRLRTAGRVRLLTRRMGLRWRPWFVWLPPLAVLVVTTGWAAAWAAPDAVLAAWVGGILAAGLALVVHACGHEIVARRAGATLRPARWDPGIALAIVGMPFHVPAGPFLADRVAMGQPKAIWWVSLAGLAANLGAAAIAASLYLVQPMPFLRVLVAVQLAVAAYSLIPSRPLDGDRLAERPIVVALLSLAVAVGATIIALGLA